MKRKRRINNEWILKAMKRYLEEAYPSVPGLADDLKAVSATFNRFEKLKITCPPLGKSAATPHARDGSRGGTGGGSEDYNPERKPLRNREKILAGAPSNDEQGVTWKALARICGCRPNTNFRAALTTLVDEQKVVREGSLYRLAASSK